MASSAAASAAASTSAAATTAPVHPRNSFASQVLGASLFSSGVSSSRVLLVGAGGIGCEVLKDLVLFGFRNVEVVDLDTIDLSNLNRQFLFNRSHIKKSKSIVAAGVAGGFEPEANIVAHHGNIKDGTKFGYDFFQSFDVVLNALDNLDARRWVNRMCIATGVPLVESGTTGFLGQVQPIVKDVMACYDCTEKPVQKTFPVCTIRSTPSTPIHCVVWAKTWLFTQLFGEDDETETAELDKAEADGGNSDEINALRKEAGEMRSLRSTLTTSGAAQRVFDKVFKADVDRLLGMDEMWRNRKKPTPLVYAEAKESTAMPTATTATAAPAAASSSSAKSQTSLRDQRQLSLKETVEMFTRSLDALAQRASSSSTALSFDKDDEDALDFVTSASNLRSIVYTIETKTRFDVKQMAGNIIPAIASTNAIISGALVLQALHLLAGDNKAKSGSASASLFGTSSAHDVMLGKSTRHVLSGTRPPPPNPQCSVCADAYVPLVLSGGTTTADVTLGAVISLCRNTRSEGGLGLDEEEELGVYEGNRLLADPDFEDNHERSLSSLGVEEGKFLALVDEDGVRQTVQVIIVLRKEGEAGVSLPPEEKLSVIRPKPKAAKKEEEDEEQEDVAPAKSNGAADGDDDGFEIVDPAAAAAAAPPSAAAASKKRKSDGDDVDGEEEASKKRRSEANGNGEAGEGSKKRRREADEDDDVIVLD